MPSGVSLSKLFAQNEISFTDIFETNSTVEDGIKIISKKKFIEYFTSLQHVSITGEEAEIFYRIASKNKNRIDIEDFLQFEKILKSEHCEYDILLQLMKDNDLKNVADLIKQTNIKNVDKFGKFNLQNYLDFTQFIKLVRQENLSKFKDQAVISIEDTKNLFFGSSFRHNLQLHFEKGITFPELLAISSVYSKMDSVRDILEKIDDAVVTKSNFAKEANKTLLFTSFSPLEIDVLFRLAGGLQSSLNLQAFLPLVNPSYRVISKDHSHPNEKLSASMELFKGIYNFTLGSLAGAIGAAAVYPIDLVKTRMQNQRAVVGQFLYKNSFDCFKKVVKLEGVLGLYSGLAPQLVGVAPEKAIKLTMNDLVRSRMKNQETGYLPVWAEIMAGMAAGGSQVLFTNPLEIVKIRLQVQGEVAKNGIEGTARMGAIGIVKQLGLLGLYKGVSACLLRDIPFSGIFFPLYAHIKKDMFHEGVNGKKMSIPELLISGAMAGMPAAYLVTPADVIKTRLQVAARKGETTYNGISDAFTKILKEEGPKAFFKGGLARIFRSSPQFGVTLASYEVLQQWLHVDFGDNPSQSTTTKLSQIEIGTRNAMRLIRDLSIKP